MSLIRQVWLLILGVLLMSLVGSMATLVITTRDTLQTHLQLRNADAATMLALALSQQQGDADRMRLVAMAQFDTGHYALVRLLGPDGSVMLERAGPQEGGMAPGWFGRWARLGGEAGVAQVSDGWRPLGSLQVVAQSSWAVDSLWAGCLRAVGFMGLVGMLAAGLGLMAVRAWRKPLNAVVQQAFALEAGRFEQNPEPRVPELRRVVRAMNALVRRLQTAFETQAEQVNALRMQASTDPVTGLMQRRAFVNQVESALRQAGGRGASLLLLRLSDLNEINQRLGHDAADRLLGAVADTLQAYPRSVVGALCGRLNGSDFGLYLPAMGVAEETAASLIEGLRAAMGGAEAKTHVVIGAADPILGGSVLAALAAADAALARAEAQGAFSLSVAGQEENSSTLQGEQAWRLAIATALEQDRVALQPYPVLRADGSLVHLECPLRLRLLANGPLEPAATWLWMALRAQLTAPVDLRALVLALTAISRDGQPRCVHVAAASLSSAGFIDTYAAALETAPAAARLLAVEVNECVATDQTRLLEQAARRWRPLGARLGLEHAGAALKGLARLTELGVDYIKIDDRHVQGVGSEAGVREFARSLVTLAHSMGVQVIASGVHDEADLAALWQIGFDAVTGPAIAADEGHIS
jgi:diguanylate cyclase (GGDEF)-like protein